MNKHLQFRILFGYIAIIFLVCSCNTEQAIKIDDSEQKITPEFTTRPTFGINSELKSTPLPAESISPQGLLVYTSINDDFSGIYVIDPQSDNPPMLVSSYPMGDFFPSWSPDGNQIAVTSLRYGENIDLFLLSVDGSNITRLTEDPAVDMGLDFSPDGKKIAFASNRDGNVHIFIANIDGNHAQQITSGSSTNISPKWSPDGTKLAFTSDRSGNADIFVMDIDGSNLIQLTSNPDDDIGPDWSPDGTKIVYTSFVQNNYDLYRMNIDGTGNFRLTTNPAIDENPAWSQDGRFIAFDTDRQGNFDIFLLDLETGTEYQITSESINETNPGWGVDIGAFSNEPWFGYAMCVRDLNEDFIADEPTETFFTTDVLKYVYIQYRNMEDGMNWSYSVLFEGNKLNINMVSSWDSGAEGYYVFHLSSVPADPREFTVQLFIEDELATEVTCEVVNP